MNQVLHRSLSGVLLALEKYSKKIWLSLLSRVETSYILRCDFLLNKNIISDRRKSFILLICYQLHQLDKHVRLHLLSQCERQCYQAHPQALTLSMAYSDCTTDRTPTPTNSNILLSSSIPMILSHVLQTYQCSLWL